MPPRPRARPAVDLGELSAYEREREARIAANAARLASLQVKEAAAALAPPPKAPRAAAKRGVKRERADPGPRRESARLQGVQADGRYVEDELRGGKLILTAGPGGGRGASPPAERERHPAGDVAFASTNEGDDAAYLAALRAVRGGASTAGGLMGRLFGRGGGSAASPSPPLLSRLAGATLAEADVAKVTRDGIVHLAFHPTAPKLLLAAGAKSGRISLFDVNASTGAPTDDAGVLEFAGVHNQYISGLKWVAATGVLMTCSYDGSVRTLDPEAAAFRPALLDSGAEFSAFDAADDGSVAVVGDKDGDALVIDPRTPGAAPISVVALADRKINTLHLTPGPSPVSVAASFSNGDVRVFDLRALRAAAPAAAGKAAKLATPTLAGGHTHSAQAAYWCPDGSRRLLTTSRDNTLGVWEEGAGGSLSLAASCPHDNDTGRWIIPFRAVWAPAGDGVLCGGMRRTVDVFKATGGRPVAALRDDAMTAIASRLAAHPTAGVLAAATASGRVNVWRH